MLTHEQICEVIASIDKRQVNLKKQLHKYIILDKHDIHECKDSMLELIEKEYKLLKHDYDLFLKDEGIPF